MILARQKLQQVSPASGKLWMIPSALSHNAGIITALIGSTTYSCTLSGLVANTRYQIYVVPGSTTLQFSTRENSLGPLGFTSWILIGAFLTNNLSPVGFGGFFNSVDGMPETDWFTLNNTIGGLLIGSTTNPTYGTVQTNIAKGKRIGREFHLHWDYKQTAAGANGTGAYYIICPHPVDYTYHKASNAHTWSGEVGTLGVIEETSGAYAGVNRAYFPGGTADRISAFISMGNGTGVLKGDWGSGYSHFNVAQITFGLQVRWAVQNWGNTPLKDL